MFHPFKQQIMTQTEINRYSNLAIEKLKELDEELDTFKTMQFDETVLSILDLHIDMIEFKHSNIQKMEQEREQLVYFFTEYLI